MVAWTRGAPGCRGLYQARRDIGQPRHDECDHNSDVPAWLWVISAAFLVLGLALLLFGAWKRGEGFLGKIAADAGIAVLTGAIVAVPIVIATDSIEQERIREARRLEAKGIRAEIRRDNIRFVREVATQPVVLFKPFGELDLRHAQLSQLDLSGADLHGTDLFGAYMYNANLSNANMVYARLSNANLHATNMSGAELVHADLRGARLDGAVLAGADLADTDLTDATYDRATVWPDGYRPPASSVGSDE
jgi:hypothetical protein